MNRERTCFKTEAGLEVVVTDDGSRTLRRCGTQTTWHSESGAVSESELVFIRNSNLLTRLRAGRVRVLEIGFGTGLNFWLAASIAFHNQSPLEYETYEPNLLSWAVVLQLKHADQSGCQPGFATFAKLIFDARRHEEQIDVCENGVRFRASSIFNFECPSCGPIRYRFSRSLCPRTGA